MPRTPCWHIRPTAKVQVMLCGWWVDAADREADDGDVVGVGVDLGGLAELGGGGAAQAEDEERCQQTTPHRGASSPTGDTWRPGAWEP